VTTSIAKIGFCLLVAAAAGQGARAQSAAPSIDCAAAATQARMTECAYEEFLAATAAYSASYRKLSSRLGPRQRDQLRRTQKLWIGFRTAACRLESSEAEGGSMQGMINWQCASRMTRARTAELEKLAGCPEGDVSCPPAVK
jgi:uncharacterized protein YecT (DUF1311 family)